MSSRSSEPEAGTLPGLGYRFANPDLLVQALTHRSFGTFHNERLEFLGDGLLNFVAADLLYRDRPEVPEGDLSRLRARLVRDRTLAEIARELELGPRLRLGAGELKSGGHLRESILADTLEAIVGAVYIDGGFDAARELVMRLLRKRIDELPEAEALKDPKTRLQEYLQARGLPLPEYQLVAESGADHERRFVVACRISLMEDHPRAEAASRRKAEQAAARKTLQALTGKVTDLS